MADFLQRLRERKLVQWALAYLAGAWVLLQVIGLIGQQFDWPQGLLRGITVAAGVGFFVTLVLAWYHGERGAQRVSGSELLIIALLLAIGGGLLWRLAQRGPAATEADDKVSTAAPPDSRKPVVAAAARAKSIAVLPFENLSHDPDNAYFAEGIQDEILTRLAKIADLKVISRTSTARYKSAPENLREIAAQLGVANILEGSVQKAGEQVRINVQLIDAGTDAHLWADIYDRQLTDIFAVESDVAKSIADTLQAKLTGSEQVALAAHPTENPEAYQLYLRGRFFWNKRTHADLLRSIDYFGQAIGKDPNYALAYASLAQAQLLLPGYDGGAPKEWFPKAEAAAQRALALDDKSSDAHAALGVLKILYRFDAPGSIAEFERAIQLNPNDATAHHWLANHALAASGQIGRQIAEMRRALEIDPLSLILNTNLGEAYIYAGRYDEAIAQLQKTVEMDAGFYYDHVLLGVALGSERRIPEAIAEFRKAIAITDDPTPTANLGYYYGVSGQKEEAARTLEQLRQIAAQRYVPAYFQAIVQLGLGNRDEALKELARGYEERDGFNISVIRVDPLLAPLHGDPRFEALAERIMPARDFKPDAAAVTPGIMRKP